MFNGRRQPSRGGTSRMMREYQVRFCERLGVKFPGPTRQNPNLPHCNIHGRFHLNKRTSPDPEEYSFARWTGLLEPPLWVLPAHPPDVWGIGPNPPPLGDPGVRPQGPVFGPWG
jgi:hypothetical protein